MSGSEPPTGSFEPPAGGFGRPGGGGYQPPGGGFQPPGGSSYQPTIVGGYQPPGPQGRRRGGHGLRNTIIALLVLIVVLVAIDRLAAFYVQGRIASQIQDEGFSGKPDVSIKGFPFLTQVIGRHFQDIQISSRKVKAGPVEIQNINAELSNVHLNSGFSGGTVGHLSGAGVIAFGSLSNAIGSLAGGQLGSLVGAAGLTLKPVGSHKVKASINLLVTSGSATWRITRVSGSEIKVHLVSSSGLPGGLLSSIRNISVPIPKLPLGMQIQSVTVTPAGISVRVTGNQVAFGS
jgi:LmeA-like phospholipid-binding